MTKLKGHRYPVEVIQYALYLFQVHKYTLRQTAFVLKANRIDVSYKTVYEWVQKFGRNFKYPSKVDLLHKKNYLFNVKSSMNGKNCRLTGVKSKDGLVIALVVAKPLDKAQEVISLMQLKNGILIDDDDAYLIDSYYLCVSKKRNCAYAMRRSDRKYFRLGRLIIKANPGMEVDHINRNVLDNRKENLRICTRSENCMNRKSWKKDGLPKGIYFKPKDNKNKPFRAELTKNGKTWRELFSTLEEAIDARNKQGKIIHGDFFDPA